METKKILVPTIIAVVFLIILTVGATYAYFSVQMSGSVSNTTINTTIASVGSITVTNSSPASLSMIVTASQMMDAGEDVTYYAQLGTNQAATKTVTTPTIATVSVSGGGTYSCDYTLTITASSTGINTYTAFQGMTGKSANQIVLTINTETVNTLDFNTANLFTNKTITGTLTGLTSSNSAVITAQLKLVNKTGLDQTALAGSDIAISIAPTTFNCSITA